jgi:hypothetical protein
MQGFVGPPTVETPGLIETQKRRAVRPDAGLQIGTCALGEREAHAPAFAQYP